MLKVPGGGGSEGALQSLGQSIPPAAGPWACTEGHTKPEPQVGGLGAAFPGAQPWVQTLPHQARPYAVGPVHPEVLVQSHGLVGARRGSKRVMPWLRGLTDVGAKFPIPTINF